MNWSRSSSRSQTPIVCHTSLLPSLQPTCSRLAAKVRKFVLIIEEFKISHKEVLDECYHMSQVERDGYMVKKVLTFCDLVEKANSKYIELAAAERWLPALQRVDKSALQKNFGANVLLLDKSKNSNRGCHNCAAPTISLATAGSALPRRKPDDRAPAIPTIAPVLHQRPHQPLNPLVTTAIRHQKARESSRVITLKPSGDLLPRRLDLAQSLLRTTRVRPRRTPGVPSAAWLANGTIIVQKSTSISLSLPVNPVHLWLNLWLSTWICHLSIAVWSLSMPTWETAPRHPCQLRRRPTRPLMTCQLISLTISTCPLPQIR